MWTLHFTMLDDRSAYPLLRELATVVRVWGQGKMATDTTGRLLRVEIEASLRVRDQVEKIVQGFIDTGLVLETREHEPDRRA